MANGDTNGRAGKIALWGGGGTVSAAAIVAVCLRLCATASEGDTAVRCEREVREDIRPRLRAVEQRQESADSRHAAQHEAVMAGQAAIVRRLEAMNTRLDAIGH